MYWITVSNSQKSKMYRHSKQILLWFQNKKMYVLSFFWHYWICYYDFDIKNHFPRFHLAFSPFSCDFKDTFIILIQLCYHIHPYQKRKMSLQWRHTFRWTKQTSSAKTYKVYLFMSWCTGTGNFGFSLLFGQRPQSANVL